MTNNLQFIFAVLLPTVTVLVGILLNNGRFNAVDSRLMNLENKLADFGQRLSHIEGTLGEK